MKKAIFEGSGVAIVTPFTDSGVNFDKLGELIDWQISEKTDAIVVCGTTGETPTLTLDEHKKTIEFAVKHAKARVPVIAGTGSNSTLHAIEMSKFAESVGADAVLIMPPYYNKTTQLGLFRHVEAIAEEIKIPVVLYNIPSRTGGLGFSLETLKKLNEIDNVNAVKEASGNAAFAAQVAAETDFVLYSGNDDITLPILSLGGNGVISVVANILPRETHEICEDFLDGNVEESGEKFLKMLDLVKTLFIEVNPIPIKTAMNLLGMNVGKLRMPLCEMSDGDLLKLKTSMKNYGLEINAVV
jgi:4-hydroxy-tetrahydrodipicolinate synthase